MLEPIDRVELANTDALNRSANLLPMPNSDLLAPFSALPHRPRPHNAR